MCVVLRVIHCPPWEVVSGKANPASKDNITCDLPDNENPCVSPKPESAKAAQQPAQPVKQPLH